MTIEEVTEPGFYWLERLEDGKRSYCVPIEVMTKDGGGIHFAAIGYSSLKMIEYGDTAAFRLYQAIAPQEEEN
jgi:hypothetical protein